MIKQVIMLQPIIIMPEKLEHFFYDNALLQNSLHNRNQRKLALQMRLNAAIDSVALSSYAANNDSKYHLVNTRLDTQPPIAESLHNTESQASPHIVLFVGGFCDSIYRVVFEAFISFIQSYYAFYIDAAQNNQHDKISYVPTPYILYSTFNCFDAFASFIPKILARGFNISIISHSWGAKNILRLCLHYDFDIENLISLDCVGHFKITHRPRRIKHWENIFIANYFESYHRSNLAALIGGAKGKIIFADSNLSLHYPANHASVAQMLEVSSLFKNIWCKILDTQKSV